VPNVTTGTQLRFYLGNDNSDEAETKPPFVLKTRRRIHDCVEADYVLTVMLTSMTIGMLCSRSLHYQFFAYIAWGTPFMLWKAKLHPVLIYAVWGAQEWAWNVYPSTDDSSVVVVGCLAIQVLGVLWATKGPYQAPPASARTGTDVGKSHVE
jgi:hypothetical protein